jgi:CRP-like cAMP-binding protein
MSDHPSGADDATARGPLSPRPAPAARPSFQPAPAADQALGLIARQALFTGVPLDTVRTLAEQCEVRHLLPGDLLLSPGESNHTLYLLLDGRMKVHLDRVDSVEGFPIAPGECVGETMTPFRSRAMISASPSATCRARASRLRCSWSEP